MRQELATIVAIREQELSDVKRVYPLMAISTEEIRKREAALAEAKLRLAEGK